MEFLLVILVVIVAIAFLRRGGPTLFRRGPRTVVRPQLRRRVADEATWRDEVLTDDPLVADEPVRRRRVIDEY